MSKNWKDAPSESLGLVYYLEVAHLVRNRLEFVVVQLEKFQAHEPRNLGWYVRDVIPPTPQNRESLQVGPDCENLFRGLGSRTEVSEGRFGESLRVLGLGLLAFRGRETLDFVVKKEENQIKEGWTLTSSKIRSWFMFFMVYSLWFMVYGLWSMV